MVLKTIAKAGLPIHLINLAFYRQQKANWITNKLSNKTIPHETIGKFSASIVLLKPAVEGTGVIAGGGARAVLNLAGVHNIIAKSLGSNDKWNVVQATVVALKSLRTIAESTAMRQQRE